MATMPQCSRCETFYSGLDFCAKCRIADLESALRNLVDKLDVVDEAVTGVFVLAKVHGVEYDGPNYGDEREAARRLLL